MRGENLNGNDAVQARVMRLIHLARPAGAEWGLNFVGPVFCA